MGPKQWNIKNTLYIVHDPIKTNIKIILDKVNTKKKKSKLERKVKRKEIREKKTWGCGRRTNRAKGHETEIKKK